MSIICMSTGGPVTTATWRKDNKLLIIDEISYQSTQIIVDGENGVYKNILYSNDASSLVGVFTCTVENAHGSDSMTISTNGKLEPSPCMFIKLFCNTCCLGVNIIKNETYTVGSNATITCHSDTPTERIEWLRDNGIVIGFGSMLMQLDLHFTPVNDSVHGQVYICRVTRNISEVAEQNFTMSVEGK